ncbi:hypothetical protein CMO83_04095 [Candidatus Woesearchaeota archaeon]|nr:hypothetical protein [Candidatus Woesearchaeota archaeon]MDP6648056.1 hypothetical protein [Candidatus Woesearchaeota archaeon]
MRVVISKNHLRLNNKLAAESNLLARRFNNNKYSKIQSIDKLLTKRDISVEKKKNILLDHLHYLIAKSFSINKKKFNKKTFESLKGRLYNIRRIIDKLRSINYYLETTFLQELKLSNLKIIDRTKKPKQQSDLARDEVEALEFTAYKLIGEAVVLDKKVIKEYSRKEKKVSAKEKIELKDFDSILRKESSLLEHLEAKLPPPKALSKNLIKEPVFTHWVARIFALLSYLEHTYSKEKELFKKLKGNKAAKIKINKKIMHIIAEKSKLLRIMEEKVISMKKFRLDNKFKKEFHNLTTTITL